MTWLRVLIQRLRGLFLKRRLERELEEEIQAHLDLQIEDNQRQGMNPDEAKSVALRKFGGVEQIKEVYRDRRGLPLVETTVQDIRYGWRMLLKNPGFTFIAALTLVLGIGSNTAIFSVIDAVLLKMLPVERPEQLYFIQTVGTRLPDGGAPRYSCFERFRDQSQSFTGIAAFGGGADHRFKIDGQLEEVRGQVVSGNYFSLLGVKAVLGRTFSPADDFVPCKGGPDGLVAVISYNCWTRRFGRDPAVIGKVMQLGNDPVTIIGVAQPGFYGLLPGREVEISLPMMAACEEMLREKTIWPVDAVGRLKPSVPVEQARAELDTTFQSYMDEMNYSPEERRDFSTRIDLRPASKGLNDLRRQFSQPLQALMVIVAMVLLIACANVANLLLARGAAQRVCRPAGDGREPLPPYAPDADREPVAGFYRRIIGTVVRPLGQRISCQLLCYRARADIRRPAARLSRAVIHRWRRFAHGFDLRTGARAECHAH